MEKRYLEKNKYEEPFVRCEDPDFQAAIREQFAQLLEDRATEPEREAPSELLYQLGQAVRSGQKISRTPSTLGIFRGVFFGDNVMAKYRVSHSEIDALEKYFFEKLD